MLGLSITTCAPPGATVGAGDDWTKTGAGDEESNFSRLDTIDAGNVKRLGLAWSMDLPEHVLEATPLAVGGVLYFTGGYAKVYAVDAQTGHRLWTYDPETWKFNPAKLRYTLAVNRGLAYENGRLFLGTIDGRLIALDADSGKPLWSAETVDRNSPHTITGAPRVFRGIVIIGNGGADFYARGFVTAYDAATGRRLWRFYTAPGRPEKNRDDPAMERAAATWSGEYWKTGTGGTVWNGITVDPEFNRIYIGTGNSGPYDPALRSPGNGDNLYLASIVALDPDTGRYIWHYQVNPREAWDYKATANMIAATLTIDGKPRKVLMQAPTNGFFYVLDRETGKLISAEKLGKVTWAERIDLATGRPVEAKNIRYETGESVLWPSTSGMHNWQDMAFSPATGLVYVPTMQLGTRFTAAPRSRTGVPTGDVTPSFVRADADDATGTLIAWDPLAQKARWRVPQKMMWNGGTLATAGNLVFQGTADGHLTAYDATSGQQLWRFYTGMGIIARPITYSADGRQYVSVLAGYGGYGGAVIQSGWKYRTPRRLLTFMLDGKAKLPPTPAWDMTLKPVDDPTARLSEADIAAGRKLFAMNCSSCHGVDLVATGFAMDLRESPVPLRHEALWSVVHEDALLSSGMPRFQQLTASDVDKIRAYIRAGAREALGKRQPSSHAAAGGPH
jgi:quinohemoprotein ethanol dehydrogenase